MSLDSPMNLDPVVLGERLSDSRRERGMTQQEAGEAIGVARTTITAIEKGTRKPRPSELARLLLLYGRSVSDFAHSTEQRQSPPFLVQFRDTGRSVDSEPYRIQAIQQFEQLCRWYRALELESGLREPTPLPPSYSLQSLTPVQAGDLLASAERSRLGLGDGPIADLWKLLESDLGFRIFSFPMAHTQIAGMFVLSGDLGVCVALNANHPVERQRWTLAHEYAHLLADRYKPEISVLGSRRRSSHSERIADAFAIEFLMPTTGIVRRFQALHHETGGRITPTELLQLSHLYGVSVQSMTHRLEDSNLIPPDSWDRLQAAGFKPRAAQRILGISSEKTGKSRFPARYVALCVQSFQAGELSEGQLARRLLSDRVEARRIVEETSSADILQDDGEIRQLSLDLDLDLVAGTR